jgi:DNA-binding CsgD family transcriptional regulator
MVFATLGARFLEHGLHCRTMTEVAELAAELVSEAVAGNPAGISLTIDDARTTLQDVSACAVPNISPELRAYILGVDPLIATARVTGRAVTETQLFGSFEAWCAFVQTHEIPADIDFCIPYAAVPLVDEQGFMGCLQLNAPRPLSCEEMEHLAFVAGQASVLLASLRERPTLECARTLATLNPRELELLQYLARGLSNSDLALVLGIGFDGVKKALSRVYRKLHVANRAEAVGVLHQAAQGARPPSSSALRG